MNLESLLSDPRLMQALAAGRMGGGGPPAIAPAAAAAPAASAAMMQEQPGAPAQNEQMEQQMRRDRIKGAMMEAKAGFDAGLETAPKPTPVTGPQPPQSRPPGQVEGATVGNMTPGPFPQRMTPETAPMQAGSPFPMSRGFRGGFPRFGSGGY